MTVPRLRRMKAAGDKITMVTAYDATFATMLDEAGVDALLVGDSLGMVVQGARLDPAGHRRRGHLPLPRGRAWDQARATLSATCPF